MVTYGRGATAVIFIETLALCLRKKREKKKEEKENTTDINVRKKRRRLITLYGGIRRETGRHREKKL